MTFNEYQQEAIVTAIYSPDYKIMYPALGLAGEAGEVANKVKKIFRDDSGKLTETRKAEVRKELGGVLWYIASLAEDCGLKMDEIAQENIKILRDRQSRGVIKGSGDNR